MRAGYSIVKLGAATVATTGRLHEGGNEREALDCAKLVLTCERRELQCTRSLMFPLSAKSTVSETGCLRNDVQLWCSAACRSASRGRAQRPSTPSTSSPSRMSASSGSDALPAKPKVRRAASSGYPATAARCAAGTSARRTTARTSRSGCCGQMRCPPSSPRGSKGRRRRGARPPGLQRMASQLTAGCQKRTR